MKFLIYHNIRQIMWAILQAEPSASMLEDELQVNADMTFDLIGNLGTLDYKTADSKEIIASYER